MNPTWRKLEGCRPVFVAVMSLLLVIWPGGLQSDEGAASESGAPKADGTETVEAIVARERVTRLTLELEKIRNRIFTRQVAWGIQSAEQYVERETRDVHRRMPDEVAMRQAEFLGAMGLTPRGFDLRKGVVNLQTSQAAAFYDPETKRFSVIAAGLSEVREESLIIHELSHALQDQYHDLKSLWSPQMDADAALALKYVIEGEATYITYRYRIKRAFDAAGYSPDRLDLAKLETELRKIRDQERDQWIAELLGAITAKTDPRVRNAMVQIINVPRYLFWQKVGPYIKGQYAIHYVYAREGWDGVDQLLRHPPSSTEQVLHPEKLRSPRDEPTQVRAPRELAPALGNAWSLSISSTMGEAGMLALFDEHLPREKVKASDGWDGDLAALYTAPSNKKLLCWWTVWDNGLEAQQFVSALERIPFEDFLQGAGDVRRLMKNEGIYVTLLVGSSEAVEKAHTFWQPDVE